MKGILKYRMRRGDMQWARNLGTLVESDRYVAAVPDDTSGKEP